MNPKHKKFAARRPVRMFVGLATALGAATLAAGTLVPAQANEYPTTDTPSIELGNNPVMTGRAYGIGITDTKIVGLTVHDGFNPDTGYVATEESSLTTPQCGRVPNPVITASLLCPSVLTDAERSRSEADHAVATVRIGIPGLPVVEAEAVRAHASATCTGKDGWTRIDRLKVGSKVVIAAPTYVAPNTSITVAGITLVLNEQEYADFGHGVKVNALHLKVNVPGVAKANVVVSSAQAGVARCYVLD